MQRHTRASPVVWLATACAALLLACVVLQQPAGGVSRSSLISVSHKANEAHLAVTDVKSDVNDALEDVRDTVGAGKFTQTYTDEGAEDADHGPAQSDVKDALEDVRDTVGSIKKERSDDAAGEGGERTAGEGAEDAEDGAGEVEADEHSDDTSDANVEKRGTGLDADDANSFTSADLSDARGDVSDARGDAAEARSDAHAVQSPRTLPFSQLVTPLQSMLAERAADETTEEADVAFAKDVKRVTPMQLMRAERAVQAVGGKHADAAYTPRAETKAGASVFDTQVKVALDLAQATEANDELSKALAAVHRQHLSRAARAANLLKQTDEGSACGYDSQGEFRCKLTSARVGGGGHALAALKQTEPKKANPPPRKHYTYVPPPPPTSTFRHTGNATRDEKFKKAHPPPAKKAGAPPPPPDDVAKLLAPAPPADVAKAIAEARAKRLAANEAVVTATLVFRSAGCDAGFDTNFINSTAFAKSGVRALAPWSKDALDQLKKWSEKTETKRFRGNCDSKVGAKEVKAAQKAVIEAKYAADIASAAAHAAATEAAHKEFWESYKKLPPQAWKPVPGQKMTFERQVRRFQPQIVAKGKPQYGNPYLKGSAEAYYTRMPPAKYHNAMYNGDADPYLNTPKKTKPVKNTKDYLAVYAKVLKKLKKKRQAAAAGMAADPAAFSPDNIRDSVRVAPGRKAGKGGKLTTSKEEPPEEEAIKRAMEATARARAEIEKDAEKLQESQYTTAAKKSKTEPKKQKKTAGAEGRGRGSAAEGVVKLGEHDYGGGGVSRSQGGGGLCRWRLPLR